MKSKLRFILATMAVWLTASCNKLDIPPKSLITDDDVFGSEAGVTAYLVRLYEALPIETFTYAPTVGFRDWTHFSGLGANTGEFKGSDYVYGWGIGSGFGYWPYADIRRANYLIGELPNHKVNFSEEQISGWLGEAYFARAYYYFGLVKRYGGVPVITAVLQPTMPIEELQLPRNKEDEVWSQIGADLDQAIALLPAARTRGRANRYVAAALKSRAMLYAGTVAKYGTVQLDGLVGIPQEKAQGYFRQSYEAAKLLDGQYSLYRANGDKVQNYVDVFFDQGSPENVFVKEFVFSAGVAHSFDCYNSPHQMAGPIGWGSAMNPTIEWVELFGTLPVALPDGTPIRFDSPADLLPELEPRLRASVLFPGEMFRDQVIDVQGGIYESYPGGTLHTAGTATATWNGRRVMGLSGLGNDNGTFTGFHMRKYMNYRATSAELVDWRSEQDWIDIRYAEVLLNRAEAAAELAASGESVAVYLADALACINDIRDRAGASLLVGTADVDINVIRLERRKELAFENHSWWDLRRWRTAHIEIDHKRYGTFAPYYVFDEGKYIFLKGKHKLDAEFTFDIRLYYEPLPQGEIDKNSNLLPNNPMY